ncbi:MAG: uracil-DNA glycosylase family protein [Caldilineaceae bacterium]
MPGVSPVGGLARRGGCDQAARLSGLDVLGQARPRFWRPGGAAAHRGTGAGCARGQSHGRPFTGDSSGDFLYGALYRAGFANQPESHSRDDGLVLRDCFITSVGRCVPPQNRPTAAELARCRPFLLRELALLDKVQVVIALGHIAFDGYLRALREQGHDLPKLKFQHGARIELPTGLPLLLPAIT